MKNTIDFLNTIFTEVTKEISDDDSFDKVLLLDKILQIISDNFGAEACSIYLESDENREIFTCVAGKGYSGEIVNKAEYRKDEGFTGFVLRTQKPYNITSQKELASLKALHKINSIGKYDNVLWSENRTFRNLIAIPLMLKDRAIGIIKLENKIDQDSFSDDDFRTLIITGHLLTLAITQANFYQKWKKSEQLEEIIQIVPNLLKKEKKPLLEEMVNLTMKFLNAEVCFIFLAKEGYLECAAGAGYAKDVVGGSEVRYKLGEYYGLTGTIADTQQLWIINSKKELLDLKESGIAKNLGDKHYQKGWEFRNLIGLPLKVDGKILGVIKVENKIAIYGKTFSAYDAKALKIIAEVASIALDTVASRIEGKKEIKEDNIEVKVEKAINEIKFGRTEEALELGIDITTFLDEKRLLQDLKVQSSRYYQLKRQEMLGLGIDSTSQNQIVYSIIHILDDIKEKIGDKKVKINTAHNKVQNGK